MLFRCEVSFYVMCCQVMWCHVMWCSVMSYDVKWCDAMPWDGMLCGCDAVRMCLVGCEVMCFDVNLEMMRCEHGKPMSPKKPWDMHSDVLCGPGMQTTTRLRTATVTAKPLRRNTPDHTVLRCTTKNYYVPHNTTQRSTKYYSVRHSSTPYKKVLHDTAPYYTALELPTQYCSVLQSTTPYYKVLLRTRMDYSVLSFFEVLVSTAQLHRATLKPSDAQHRDAVWQQQSRETRHFNFTKYCPCHEDWHSNCTTARLNSSLTELYLKHCSLTELVGLK